MNWASVLADVASVAAQGVGAGVQVWRDRKKSSAERLADKPRPIDAALVAMLEERKRQRDASGE